MMKFALASAALSLASSASAHTLEATFERGPGHLPPLSVVERGPVTRPPLPILDARSPWVGSQGRFRNSELTGGQRLRVAASNTVGPRGGGEAYIYLY